MSPKKALTFRSAEDEATFYDRADLADLDLEPVTVRRPRKLLATTFAIRLDQPTVAQIRKVARLLGVGPTQLVRAWVLERLRLEQQAGSLAEPFSNLPPDVEQSVRQRALDAVLRSAGVAVRIALEGAAPKKAIKTGARAPSRTRKPTKAGPKVGKSRR